MRTDGIVYPIVVDSGSIHRSTEETRSALLECFPRTKVATGDVRRCISKYMGTVTAKVMFWKIKPKITTLSSVSKSSAHNYKET
jgi:hypothetical protein